MSQIGESESVRESLEKNVIAAADETGVDNNGQENSTDSAPVELSPPETWSDEDKQVWGKITDPDARKWLLGREESYTKQIGELKPVQEQLSEFTKIFEPHKERLEATGQTPAQVTDNLLKAQLVLESEPIEGMMWLVDRYKIDPAKLIEALGGAPAAKADNSDDPLADLDPNLKKFLEDKLKPVEEFQTERQRLAEAEQNRIKEESNAAIKTFREEQKDGKPVHPFLSNPEVSNRISILIKTGQVDIAKSGGIIPALKEAYDQACRSIPAVREDYLKAIAPPANPVTRERLLNAKKAGVGVRGAGGSNPSPASTGSVRETLRAKMSDSGLFNQ